MAAIKLDRAGLSKILKSAGVASAVHNLAEEIAGNVGSDKPDADIVVDDYTTDRAASSVTIRDARGRIWQARDGVLTKAAGKAGVKVRAKR